MKKLPKITESMVKRYNRTSDGQQHSGSPCIFCGKGWDDCPYELGQIGKIIAGIQMAQMLGVQIGKGVSEN